MARFALILTAFAACLMSAPAEAEMIIYHATLNGAAEVPPTKSQGTGTAKATIDTDTKMLSYEVQYTGLSGPVMMGHFHGPAAADENAAILIPMVTKLTSPIAGMAKLSDAEIADFQAGKVYVNLHTKENPTGEIRGQLAK